MAQTFVACNDTPFVRWCASDKYELAKKQSIKKQRQIKNYDEVREESLSTYLRHARHNQNVTYLRRLHDRFAPQLQMPFLHTKCAPSGVRS
jgi:hypothetical protein